MKKSFTFYDSVVKLHLFRDTHQKKTPHADYPFRWRRTKTTEGSNKWHAAVALRFSFSACAQLLPTYFLLLSSIEHLSSTWPFGGKKSHWTLQPLQHEFNLVLLYCHLVFIIAFFFSKITTLLPKFRQIWHILSEFRWNQAICANKIVQCHLGLL